MPDHNEAMRLADEVRVVADRLQYTPGGFYGVETVGPINQAAALLRQLSAERDQLRAEVEMLRKPLTPEAVWQLWAEVCKPERPTVDLVEAFARAIEAAKEA